MMDSVIQFRGTIYENGYGLLAQKVMRDKTLPRQSKLIYAYMCSFASINTENGERTAFPSVSLQCDELDMSQDTYYKWRKPLVDKGLITIEKRKTEGKFDRNIYYIEAVPVPLNTDTEPYPKNSGTVIPSTEKSGTNSNSLNSNNFNNISNTYIHDIDDDKRTSSPGTKNSVINENGSNEGNKDPLAGPNENIEADIEILREYTKDHLAPKSFDSVLRKVLDKHNQGKINGTFRDYFLSALNKRIDDLEFRRRQERAKQDAIEHKVQSIQERQNAPQATERRVKPVPFYNWLVEREG